MAALREFDRRGGLIGWAMTPASFIRCTVSA